MRWTDLSTPRNPVSESASNMRSAVSNAWPPSPNPIETTRPRWKTNSWSSPVGYGIFTSNARSKKNNAPISIDSLLPRDNSNQTRRYNHFYAYIIKIIMWKIWRAQSAPVDLFYTPNTTYISTNWLTRPYEEAYRHRPMISHI